MSPIWSCLSFPDGSLVLWQSEPVFACASAPASASGSSKQACTCLRKQAAFEMRTEMCISCKAAQFGTPQSYLPVCMAKKITQVWYGMTMHTSLLVLSRQSIDQSTFLVFRTHHTYTSNRHIKHALSTQCSSHECKNCHTMNIVVQTSGGGSGRRESAPALLAGYENLLAHLKSQGALLNAVKPELLLDITDFRSPLACAHNNDMHHDAFLCSGLCTQQCHAS